MAQLEYSPLVFSDSESTEILTSTNLKTLSSLTPLDRPFDFGNGTELPLDKNQTNYLDLKLPDFQTFKINLDSLLDETFKTKIVNPFTDSFQTKLIFNSFDQILTGIQGCFQDKLNNLNLNLDLPGLLEQVKIAREPSGVIHIQAANDQDLFFALGLAHAHDRLWQMDFQRRVATGRLSEILGPETLQEDIFQRTLGLEKAAESAYANLDLDTKETIDNYTRGINAYLELHVPLPSEFQILDYRPEPWKPSDVLVEIKLQSLSLSTNFETELMRSQLLAQGVSWERIQTLFPLYEGDTTILQPEDVENIPNLPGSNLPLTQLADNPNLAAQLQMAEGSVTSILESVRSLSGSPDASNSWVISGEHTTTGKPFLANDPHLDLQIPSVWHLAHLEAPGINVIGATLPGTPAVTIGHNDQIAWGQSNSRADVQDLYALVETDNGYWYKGEELSYNVRLETIKVRGGEDVVIPVRESVYGPVISDALGIEQPLALRWVSLDEKDSTAKGFLDLNKAENWEEFKTALQSVVAPSQNFVYADVEGNIGYYAPGKIPIRNLEAGHTGLLPVPGTGEYDWQGFIPFDQLPQIYNPDRGYIVTANNRIAPSEYPYQISLEWAEPYRAERITELITDSIDSGKRLSLKDMQKIQLDQVSLLFQDFKPILEDLEPILQTSTSHPTQTITWLNRLLKWDGKLTTNSREATVFENWYNELTKLVAAELGQEVLQDDQLQAVPRFLLQAFTEGDPICGDSGAGCLQTAADIFQDVVTGFGCSIPTWGEVHQATFTHGVLPFERQVPFGGDLYTVNVGGYDSETFDMTAGPSYRQIINLNNLENSRFIHPMGQSGRPSSPFFDNLLQAWQKGDYLAMRTENFPVAVNLTLNPELT